MSDRLAYAGCLHRFAINEKGYLQISIFTYQSSTERFINAIEKPLIPSTVMVSKQCTVMCSSVTDKGLLVLLRLITSNSSILMLIRLQARPWSCQILHTLAIPSTIHGSLRALASNPFLSLLVTDQPNPLGFYRIDNREVSQRTLELIRCSLSTYLYCCLKDSYYWLMGNEMDANTGRTAIQAYYHGLTLPSKSLIGLDTKQFFPLILTDKVEAVYVINHQIQLRTRSIVGDLIISSSDHRIFTSHHGRIVHELSMDHLITSIQAYRTIEDEQLYLFGNRDLQSVEIFQSEQDSSLTPFTNTHQTAVEILVDDFTQIGWKQILFRENDHEINAFHLTDFSHIHVFQQESDIDFHNEEKNLSVEMNDDGDVQASLMVAQDLLRKKLINADFIVNEGYFQCRQINNDIRRLANKHHTPDLSSHVLQIDPKSTHLQLVGTHWFVYRSTLFVHLTIKNLGDTSIHSMFVFAVDRPSNKTKEFDLKSSHPSLFSTETTFGCAAQSAITFILTTSIELDREMDFDLYLLVNDKEKLARLGSIQLSIDDLIHSKHQRVLKMIAFDTQTDAMHQQMLIYLNTLFRFGVTIVSKSKIYLMEDLRALLSNLGFQAMRNVANAYLRLDEGNIFEHALVHLVGEDEFMTDDLIVHFYAENAHHSSMLAKYILSKLDFQSFSLIDAASDKDEQSRLMSRIQSELRSYTDGLKQLPTVMRRVGPASKSEPYRLFKLDDFQFFQNERHQTDLFLASSIIQ